MTFCYNKLMYLNYKIIENKTLQQQQQQLKITPQLEVINNDGLANVLQY